jgi:two-component system, chemotaxis family, protein-glutamate methylesterase/glutaminase
LDVETGLAPSAVVVIGASAGGVQALQELVSGLEPSLPAVWCAVLHVDAHRSEMPALLSRAGRLPACHPGNGDLLEPGRIYLAPSDLHFTVEDGHAVLSRGPRENWARPAIDPLFRSAAAAFGANTIGVILTGKLNDGTAGLMAVKQAGGTAVVQDPREAEYPAMPRNALRYVSVDHCVPLAEMAPLLTRLVLHGVAPCGGRRTMGGDHV